MRDEGRLISASRKTGLLGESARVNFDPVSSESANVSGRDAPSPTCSMSNSDSSAVVLGHETTDEDDGLLVIRSLLRFDVLELGAGVVGEEDSGRHRVSPP